tara:strand:+ start:726 stop:1346 length:621 start_codon:yes stop_codon:yes gene_type:complete
VTLKGVSIHIPTSLPLDIAARFIKGEKSWIETQLQKLPDEPPKRKWLTGDKLWFLGSLYTLELNQENVATTINLTSSGITLSGRLTSLSKTLRHKKLCEWYKIQATNYLTARSEYLSARTGLHPSSITIKTYNARWGSCNIKGAIQYNWKIIQAPKEVIDYLIIHELSHLKHHNHSKDFWQCVESFYPNFKDAQYWLKSHSSKLDI